ncbi:MAG TPA: CHAD domain-containing protein [Rhizobiaceae bacterium]|nr:CHAD domain-containing protein [Rhizobiaceae bacterium]
MSYRIDPSAPLSLEIRRIGVEQLREAVAILDAGRLKRDAGAHEARKRFKRLRGLLRLIADAAPGFRRREEQRIKEIADSLSAIRDATAMIEAIDRFAGDAEDPQAIDHLMALRRGLLARRDRILRKQGSLEATVGRAIEGLHRAEKALEKLTFRDDAAEASELLAKSVEKTCRRARKALRKAAEKGRDADFHALRKGVKYHEMHLQLLSDAWPAVLKERWKKAEKLGDRLGDLHDIPVLAATIENEQIGDKADRKLVRKIMRRKHKKLSAECLEDAGRLFHARPETVARDIAIHYALVSADRAPVGLEPVSAPKRGRAQA